MKLNLEKIVHEYFTEKKSLNAIAKRHHTYPNFVMRFLKKHGYTLRGKAEAQSAALESGRHKHPSKGKHLKEETKLKISEGVADSWSKLTPEEWEKRRQYAKDQWDAMTIEQREEFQRKAHQAIRQTASQGSKFEQALRDRLRDEGYKIQFHHKGLVPNTKLEVDIYVPTIKLAIECDGVSHFIAVWGQEALDKQRRADMEKYGLLSSAGVKVLRLKVYDKTLSLKGMRTYLQTVIDYLKGLVEIPDYHELEFGVLNERTGN